LSVYLVAFAVTLFVCVGLVLTKRWHGHYSMDSTFGVQKIHTQDTPRIGGVAIVIGLLVGWLWAPSAAREILGSMLLAGLPAFGFGLLEDITKKVSVRQRLLATLFSGVLAWYLTGVAMQDTGLAPLDWALQVLPVAVLFTAFAVGGVANAMNIIDGFNGLAAGAASIMLFAMGLISFNLGDTELAWVCWLIAACALGFNFVNWPLGKLFLGDGGAYLLGFCVAWVAVLLPMRHTEIHAWTTMLACAYPVLEVAFSVRRRVLRKGHHPGQPDKVHLHHLVHRRIVRQLFPRLTAPIQNGLTSTVCWVFISTPAAIAVLFAQNVPVLVATLFGLMLGYAAVYLRLSQFKWCFSPATLHPKWSTVAQATHQP